MYSFVGIRFKVSYSCLMFGNCVLKVWLSDSRLALPQVGPLSLLCSLPETGKPGCCWRFALVSQC